jgi:hypothetical protein
MVWLDGRFSFTHTIMAFTISKSFSDLSVAFALQVQDDTVRRLAIRFGFDVATALEFIHGNEVVVVSATKEILKKDLPWCGVVDEDCCHAISFGDKRFPQCHKAQKKGLYCTQCANQLERDGSLKYGGVDERMACGAMEYETGKYKVVSYAGYMSKHNLSEADVLASAMSHGLEIDPLQFVAAPKRARAKRSMAVAESDESESDPEAAEVAEVPEVPAEVPAVPAEVPAVAEEPTIASIRAMSRDVLNALAVKHGIVGPAYSSKPKKIEGLIEKLGLVEVEEGEEEE